MHISKRIDIWFKYFSQMYLFMKSHHWFVSQYWSKIRGDTNNLVQGCGISIANGLEISQPETAIYAI